MKKRKTYALSFREDAIALFHRSDRSMDEIADSLGVPHSTMRYWYDAEMRKKGKARGATKLPVGDPAAESPERNHRRARRRRGSIRRPTATTETTIIDVPVGVRIIPFKVRIVSVRRVAVRHLGLDHR